MRASLLALAMAGALVAVVTLSPLARAADDPVPPTDAVETKGGRPLESPQLGEMAPGAVTPEDLKTALKVVRRTWVNFNQCDRSNVCGTYFDTFGVALTFNDGSIAPFAHEHRRTLTGHDCINNAREALQRGDRGLAVQWVMAGEIDDLRLRAWMGDHPDAVIEALQHCC